MSRPLRFGGNDANLLRLKVANAKITPAYELNNGIVTAGFMLEMPQYNLDDVLCHLLDDYGEEALIKRIKEL